MKKHIRPGSLRENGEKQNKQEMNYSQFMYIWLCLCLVQKKITHDNQLNFAATKKII